MDEETNKPPMRKVIGFESNGLGGYNYHVCRAKIEEIWDGTKIVYNRKLYSSVEKKGEHKKRL